MRKRRKKKRRIRFDPGVLKVRWLVSEVGRSLRTSRVRRRQHKAKAGRSIRYTEVGRARIRDHGVNPSTRIRVHTTTVTGSRIRDGMISVPDRLRRYFLRLLRIFCG